MEERCDDESSQTDSNSAGEAFRARLRANSVLARSTRLGAAKARRKKSEKQRESREAKINARIQDTCCGPAPTLLLARSFNARMSCPTPAPTMRMRDHELSGDHDVAPAFLRGVGRIGVDVENGGESLLIAAGSTMSASSAHITNPPIAFPARRRTRSSNNRPPSATSVTNPPREKVTITAAVLRPMTPHASVRSHGVELVESASAAVSGINRLSVRARSLGFDVQSAHVADDPSQRRSAGQVVPQAGPGERDVTRGERPQQDPQTLDRADNPPEQPENRDGFEELVRQCRDAAARPIRHGHC